LTAEIFYCLPPLSAIYCFLFMWVEFLVKHHFQNAKSPLSECELQRGPCIIKFHAWSRHNDSKTTEQTGSIGDLNLGRVLFESRTRHRLSWARCFVAILIPLI
jgi:hypothetical protein